MNKTIRNLKCSHCGIRSQIISKHTRRIGHIKHYHCWKCNKERPFIEMKKGLSFKESVIRAYNKRPSFHFTGLSGSVVRYYLRD